MTIGETMSKRLFESGIFQKDVNSIMKTFKTMNGDGMKARWSDDVSGYPPQLLTALNVNLDLYVVKWIDENKPEAWYRPIFVKN